MRYKRPPTRFVSNNPQGLTRGSNQTPNARSVTLVNVNDEAPCCGRSSLRHRDLLPQTRDDCNPLKHMPDSEKRLMLRTLSLTAGTSIVPGGKRVRGEIKLCGYCENCGGYRPIRGGHAIVPDDGKAVGAGLLGFGVGAIVGSAITPREVFVAPPAPPPPPACHGPAAYVPPAWSPAWYQYCRGSMVLASTCSQAMSKVLRAAGTSADSPLVSAENRR
jgi:hypothetical protein